jgi:hypothetical protein
VRSPLLENERGPMNDQDLTKTDYDPDRSLVLIEGLSHFLTNFLQNLASCQTSLSKVRNKLSGKSLRTGQIVFLNRHLLIEVTLYPGTP